MIESRVDDQYYKLTFKDRGKKFNPLTYGEPDITQPIEERNVGGLGIYMIKHMTDFSKYEYIDGCNIFSFGVKING
jgi:sigma-B regulation protein RsbU (phosphoserine phosphatase)